MITRSLFLVAAFLLAGGLSARADTLADLRQPSSTIAGCGNNWGPFGTSIGVTEATCEGKAALAQWQTHATAINRARDTLANASNLPADRTDPQVVVDALATAAVAIDAMSRLYHPTGPRGRDFTDVLAWMRPWFQQRRLPVPGSIGDGLRTLAEAVPQPGLPLANRAALYGQATVFAIRLGVLAAELGGDVRSQADTAVRAAHSAALDVALAIENGTAVPDVATIVTAAGPAYAEMAREQTRQLNQSLAAHPEQGGYLSRTTRKLSAIPGDFVSSLIVLLIVLAIGFRRFAFRTGTKKAVQTYLRLLMAVPLTWLLLGILHALTGFPDGWVTYPLLILGVVAVLALGGKLMPASVRRVWNALFATPARDTHGSAAFGTARNAAPHLAPSAPADAFVLGSLRDAPRGASDRRFRHDGHILTCAPTGAGKGVGAVIPNLLDYPGSAFVLDFKGENHAVTARARHGMGQAVMLIDPFGVTGATANGLNWLDALDPDDPDVVSRAAGLADMLVVTEGADSDSHWNDTARELLRGLLIYVAGLPGGRRSMAELRRIVTASEDDLAETLADMLADPERGHRIPARAAAGHLNRPEKERGSVLSNVVRHTAWLDDPRLCAALARSDFTMTDLKRKPMTVYLAIPPDRLRACLGFVRGFVGLALDGVIATQARPAYRVAFFLDEFGQLGRMDRLADSITLLRGYGAQLWVFVQDLSQLKAVYPRWQSFLANTSQQFFGTADYDTARYLSNALGQQTIRFETRSDSLSEGSLIQPGRASTSTGEQFQGRSLLTPDEVMRLGPSRPIVLVSGEPPYLLDRVSYLTDAAYAGRFDPNPMHLPHAAE